MSYVSNTKDETLGGFGCGSGCGCGPCKSGGNNLNEWYEKDEAEPVAPAPRSASQQGKVSPPQPPPPPRLAGWRPSGPRFYRRSRSRLGQQHPFRQPYVSRLGELTIQSSRAAIDAALKRNPVGGYVKGSAARRALEEAFESVRMCSALELAEQLFNGEGALGKLFRFRLHHDTRIAMLQILVRKAKECLSKFGVSGM